MQNFDALIAEAYALFAGYGMGEGIAVCSGHGCCLHPYATELLRNTPVQQLERQLVYDFLDASETDDIPLLVQQMKHLLPRILELMIQGEHLGMEFALSKCKCYSGLWLEQETDFLQRFASAYFASKCTDEDIEADAVLEDTVLMFHLAGLDVWPLLKQWQAVIDQAGPFNNFVFMLMCNFETGRFESAYEEEGLNRKMTDWISEHGFKSSMLQVLIDKLAKPDLSKRHQWEYGRALAYLSLAARNE